MPGEAILFRQRGTGVTVAGHHDGVLVSLIAESGDHRFGHPSATGDRYCVVLRYRAVAQQICGCLIVGVVGMEDTVLVDDRVHRRDGGGRIMHHVDKVDDFFLEGHRDSGTADAEGS